nr:uncharacterized mitochondrial protein AtMg00810-like [Tanacetum cinerariifolium]
QPNLGLWYPRDSPFQLEAYSDSDYARSRGDRKSTTGGCQFLGRRPLMLLVVQVFLLVVLVHADGLVPAGSCTIPTGSYSFMRLDWFLLDDHNKVAYLEKGKGWEAYEQILDVLNRSHIRTYNFFRSILYGMIGNIGSKRHKFMMCPRFLQMILGIQTTDPSPRPTFDFTTKLFSNMKLNWDGPHMPLLAPMLVVPAGGDGAGAAAAGPSTATQDTPVRDPTPVRKPTLVREPTPSPVREPTTFREPTPEPPRPHSPPPPCTRLEEVGPTTSTAGNDSISIKDPLRPFEPWPTSQTTPSNTTTSTRPPSPTRQTSFLEDISEGGGGYVSSPKSNEAPPTTVATSAGGAEDPVALTDLSFKLDRCINKVTTLENELGVTKKVLGGAVLKLVSRVKRLEEILNQQKRIMVLSDSEGEEAATKEQEINLDALHELASTHTRTKRRRLRKTFTSSAFEHFQENISAVEDTIPAGDGIPADAQTIPADSTPILTTGGVSAGSSMDPAGQAAAAAPSSSAIIGSRVCKLLGDDVKEDNMNERLGMLLMRKRRELAEQSPVKPMNKTQQWDFMRDFVKNQSASVYNQGWTMKQVPASVPATSSIAADVSVSAVSTTTADVSVSELPIPPRESLGASTHGAESQEDSTTVAFTSGVSHATPSSSRRRHKQIAKKRVTPIVDVADVNLIKFDSARESDGDPSPYAPYAGWEMVPTPFGSIHAYYDIEEHTKHFTSFRELLHMVEKNDLRKLLGVPAGCSCWFPHSCWFLVAVVWLFAAVLFHSCCWNNDAILKLTSEDLSTI